MRRYPSVCGEHLETLTANHPLISTSSVSMELWPHIKKKKKVDILLRQELLLPPRLLWDTPPRPHSRISAVKEEKKALTALGTIKVYLIEEELREKTRSPALPWATPRCASTRRSRIPGVAHILTKLQAPRPIPLLCPLLPMTSDA